MPCSLYLSQDVIGSFALLLHYCILSFLYSQDIVPMDVCSVRDLRLIVMPASTRVHEATVIARLIGRLETEHVKIVYAHIGASGRCPLETDTQEMNCKTVSSLTSRLSHTSCGHHMISENFSSTTADAETLLSVAMATNDAVSQLMTTNRVWDKLSQKSRNFLRTVRTLYAAVTVNASGYVISGDYSTAVAELMLLLPVPPRDVTLPRLLLCVDCETALFGSVSGLLTLASAQHATGSQCFTGHVFYACSHLTNAERFYFRSNWSRVESELRDFRYFYSDSTTAQLYADTMECPKRVFAAISTSIEQSRGCTATDDVSRWYSACKQVLNGTNSVVESVIVESHRKFTAVWQRCMLEIVVYIFLILVQVCLSTFSLFHFIA